MQVIARMTASAGTTNGAAAPTAAPTASATTAPAIDSGANISPVARRIAAEQGVDVNGLHGSARGGRITKADVLAATANGGNGAIKDRLGARRPARLAGARQGSA